MIRSMTAFASRTGAHGGTQWSWDIRSVNARGLDLRLRLPDGIEGLEQSVRASLTKRFSRGNITLNLRLTRDETDKKLDVDTAALDRALEAIGRIEARAAAMGLQVNTPTSADILNIKGVFVPTSLTEDDEGLLKHLTDDFGPLLDDFAAMRATEGRALHAVVTDHLNRIEELIEKAKITAEERKADVRTALTSAMKRVLDDIAEVDDQRLAQELAVLAVKQDVTEELDRLRAHVAAARELISDPAPAGRKLDFLAQEFNREANTLCSKSQAVGLTAVGLELKAVIEQMREQIQNVE